MRPFEYANPTTTDEAIRLLADEKAVALAGGTDLVSLMKDDIIRPSRLVNLRSIAELAGVDWRDAEGLRIGAMVTLEDLVGNPEVVSRYPSLIQAVDGIRSPQLRAMGTVGGELVQRPRCWYYRSGFGLLAMSEGRSLVVDGDNRYHAILGNEGPANFVNPSSLAPALIALGARVGIRGADGEREIELAELYRTPQAEGESELSLAHQELVTEILLPPAGPENATYEVRQKEALDWPLAAAAVALEVADGVIRQARVVLGHVAPTPYVADSASQALVGKALSVEAAEEAGRLAVEGAKALSGNGYKIQLARVAAKRAVLRAGGMEV